MATQQNKFLEVFDEDSKEVLTLNINLTIEGKAYPVGTKIEKGDTLEGIDFHALRYLDIVLETNDDEHYVLKGFTRKAS
jgi:hypothetical protein